MLSNFKQPLVFFTPNGDSIKTLQQPRNPKINIENLNVLTMEKLNDTTILLRLEHIFEENEHSSLSGKNCLTYKFIAYKEISLLEYIPYHN